MQLGWVLSGGLQKWNCIAKKDGLQVTWKWRLYKQRDLCLHKIFNTTLAQFNFTCSICLNYQIICLKKGHVAWTLCQSSLFRYMVRDEGMGQSGKSLHCENDNFMSALTNPLEKSQAQCHRFITLGRKKTSKPGMDSTWGIPEVS